jgi:hypothetical protein
MAVKRRKQPRFVANDVAHGLRLEALRFVLFMRI